MAKTSSQLSTDATGNFAPDKMSVVNAAGFVAAVRTSNIIQLKHCATEQSFLANALPKVALLHGCHVTMENGEEFLIERDRALLQVQNGFLQ